MFIVVEQEFMFCYYSSRQFEDKMTEVLVLVSRCEQTRRHTQTHTHTHTHTNRDREKSFPRQHLKLCVRFQKCADLPYGNFAQAFNVYFNFVTSKASSYVQASFQAMLIVFPSIENSSF